MPTYNAECAACGYELEIRVTLANLDKWDMETGCPKCHGSAKDFSRIIKYAPAVHGGTKNAAKISHSKAKKLIDHDKIGLARENVATGKFENF